MPSLRIVDASERQSIGYARNQGVEAASGRLIAYCDADDAVSEGWLEAIAAGLARYGGVATPRDHDLLNEDWVRDSDPPTASGYHENWYPPYLPHTGSGGMGVRRELHEAIGGFDESFSSCEDNDYCFRLQLEGVELGSVEGAVYHYRFKDTIRTIFRQAYWYSEDNARIQRQYRSRGSSAEAVDVGHQVLAGARCAPRGCHQAGPRADGVDARMGARPASAAASSTGCWRFSVRTMRLEEPVPLHRRQSGGVVKLSPIRRDEGELARVAGDSGSFADLVDGLDELDNDAPGPAGRGAGGPIRRAAEEVRKLFVESGAHCPRPRRAPHRGRAGARGGRTLSRPARRASRRTTPERSSPRPAGRATRPPGFCAAHSVTRPIASRS